MAKQGGCYVVFMTDMRKSVKTESRTRTDALSGWETASILYQYLFPYILDELEAISPTGNPSDGM